MYCIKSARKINGKKETKAENDIGLYESRRVHDGSPVGR